MPVIATYTYLFSRGLLPIEWRSLAVFLLSVLGVVILHAAGNLLSDWADFRSGVRLAAEIIRRLDEKTIRSF